MNTGVLLQVPAFPPVATKLLHLSFDDQTGISSLIHLLRSDPALSAEIIRHANSALFAIRTDVITLDQAVTLLGVRRIRTLALAAISRTYVKGLLMVEDLRAYWRYSVACALVAERVAGGEALSEDTAYAAALLHDIGCLGLMVAYPVDYPRLLQVQSEALQSGLPFNLLDEERNLFGMDRYEAGEWLARKWNLPEDLRLAASRYDSGVGDEPVLIRVVRSAAKIANSLGFAMVVNPIGPAYEQIRETLPPERASGLPRLGADLRAHIEKEIALLDWDPCAFEQESAAREFLQLAEPENDEVVAPAEAGPPRRVVPALLVAAILVILLGLLKFVAG
jgi:HD-like signal output (HDOD) protein